MTKSIKGLSYLLFFCLALNSSVFASVASGSGFGFSEKHGHKNRYYKDHYKDEIFASTPNHFEVIGAGGIAKLDASNGHLGVTSSETDELVQTNSNTWNTKAAQLGLGYIYYFRDVRQHANNVQWFPSIEPELNVYYLASDSINGDVYRFNNPAYNELTFDMPFHSTRLMLDVALTVASWRQLSLYAKGGVGNAWNRIGYSDQYNNGNPADCPDQNVSLSSNTKANFAWEAGAGMFYAFNDRFGLSLEYLYTHFGTVSTSGSGSTGTITVPAISAANFNLASQTALLGLHIAL